jgi:hypothetical protein
LESKSKKIIDKLESKPEEEVLIFEYEGRFFEAKEILDFDVEERGPQLRTKVKYLKETFGSRNIRNLTEKANSFVTKMLDSTNNYPSPKDSASANRLQMTQTMLTESARLLKEVKDKKAKKR